MRLFSHRLAVCLTLTTVSLAGVVRAAEPVDLDAMNRIRDEGLNRSQVMGTLEELVDRYGPRLTASPEEKQAAEWAKGKLAGWGLSGAHLEGFEYGEGWSFSKCAVRIIEPFATPVYALPRAWTPGTGGPVHGPVVKAKFESDEDYTAQKGKLKGKVVFISDAHEVTAEDQPKPENPVKRYSAADLDELEQYPIPGEKKRDWYSRAQKRWNDSEKLNAFLVEEGATAVVDISWHDEGIVGVSAAGSRGLAGRSRGVPHVTMAAEPYERILRLIDRGTPVELELDIVAEFHPEETKSYNVIAELPGSDKKAEVVMLGAHLDAWHAATGATDNGAGVAVAMEAARILRASGLKLRRTVRIALWTGEEQGEIGSNAYVREHFAERPDSSDPDEQKYPPFLRHAGWPIHPKPEHARLSAYFNLDNGGGKVRGIYAQSNVAVMPIFTAWLAPFADLGADTVVSQDTDSTDHEVFDGVGLPGFQFIQDELDYESRTHHTNLDTFEHVHRDDMVQAAVVMAAFVYDAASRDQMLPRKPMPQEPPQKPKTEEKPKPAADAPVTPPATPAVPPAPPKVTGRR